MSEAKKKMPKGGKKGGTRFPQVQLNDAISYAEKLVSKTHGGPQPADIILPGVFGTSGPIGKVRASALIQYNLLEGSPKGYIASELAKEIVAATEEDKQLLLKRALLSVPLYRKLFDTFCDATESKARIRQQALKLKVHPDNSDKCVGLFINSAVDAGLASVTGDSVAFISTPQLAKEIKDEEEEQGLDYTEIDEHDPQDSDNTNKPPEKVAQAPARDKGSTTPVRANVAVDIKVDPSMDPEKLEKQLKLLRQFGVI